MNIYHPNPTPSIGKDRLPGRHLAKSSASALVLALALTSCADRNTRDEELSKQSNIGRPSSSSTTAAGNSNIQTLELEEISSAKPGTGLKPARHAQPYPSGQAAAVNKAKAPRLEQTFSADSSVSAIPAHRSMLAQPSINRENYLAFERNNIQQVSEQPVSTFSIDVDTAAYSNIRRILQQDGQLPPHHAVKIEEMINYFDYDYPQPKNGRPFSVTTELAQSPWNPGRQLLHIGIQGLEPEMEQRPAANLVFLVDVSGSMRSADKLGLVKKSLRLLTNRLNADDRIALVVYAGAAGLVLESTPASERSKIMQAIEGLNAGGSTNGSAGIRLAYQQAREHFIEGGINRVLIASDGDLNVGTVNLDALKNLIAEQRESGVSLTTLGFGRGNYNYALMEQLADNGNGNAAYIDSLQEAQKVLVTQINGTLHTIASDVKIQIEFNPTLVSEYRLIGYENRMLKREDFRNDRVDAGEIGAGHSVTALYEITPASSDAQSIAPLRYGESEYAKPSKVPNKKGELAYVRLRYKTPGGRSSVELAQAIKSQAQAPALAEASQNLRFASSVAGFGGLLAGGKYTRQWSYADALQLARSSRGNDPHGYRGEFLRLVELAHSFSTPLHAQGNQG